MQRRAELYALANDFAFLQGDNGRDDFNVGLGASAHANQFLKDAVIFRAAIGIAGAVFRYRADVDGVSADDFRPAYRYGKEMRVAKRHISYGDFVGARVVRDVLIFGDDDVGVGQRGAADGSKMIQLNNQPMMHI